MSAASEARVIRSGFFFVSFAISVLESRINTGADYMFSSLCVQTINLSYMLLYHAIKYSCTYVCSLSSFLDASHLPPVEAPLVSRTSGL